jgi:hypothetical protein
VAGVIGEYDMRVIYRETWNGLQKQATAVKTVLVLPPGTFKVSGRVGTPGGARGDSVWVTVLSGNLAGTSVRGGGTGYRLLGAVGPIELEAVAADHVTQRRELNVTGHTIHDFELAPIFSGADVSGVWTLTLVDPAPSCPPGFPAAARGRAYTLTIVQAGQNLALHLSRPGLSVQGAGSMSGAVKGNQVTLAFLFQRNEYTGEILNLNIFDRLSATETLSWEATINGTYTGNDITASASGTIIYTNAPNSPPAWQCTASNHVFTVRR